MKIPKFECLESLSLLKWIHQIKCLPDGTITSDLSALCDFLHLPLEGAKNLSLYSITPSKSKLQVDDFLKNSQDQKSTLAIYSQLPPFPKTKVYEVICIRKKGTICLFLHCLSLEKTHSTSHRLMDLGLLTAGFFHDFNNHLGHLMFFCESLSEGNLDEKKSILKKKLMFLAEQSHQITSYIKDDASTQKKSSAKKNLRTTCDMFNLSLPSSISCMLNLLEEEVQIPLSSGAFSHILLNLLSNAKQALGEKGGKINISSHLEANELKIIISDTGHGIEEKDLPYLFSPFFSKKDSSSSGLGLAISKQLIELAGGNITCTSLPNQGATFIISLPTL